MSGSGLGRCTAHELKSLGARLAPIGRTAEKLDQAWAGRIDGLVSSAGGLFPAELKDISLNGWNAVVANNMTATFLRQGGGSVSHRALNR